MIIRRSIRWLGILLFAFVALVVLTLCFFRFRATQREVGDRVRTAPSAGHFVRAAGLEIFVEEAGPTQGTPVLFVHGTGAWSETWHDAMQALASAGYHVVAIDLPPFGYSERPSEALYTAPDQAKRILGVTDTLHLNKVLLVGHSFGSRSTMEAALEAPEKVRGVVLVDAALDLTTSSTKESLPTRLFLAWPPVRDAVVSATLSNPAFTKTLLKYFIYNKAAADDARVAIYQKPLTLKGTTAAAGKWLSIFLAPAAPSLSTDERQYKNFRLPVRLLWGEQDTITPLALGRHLQSLIPDSQLVVLPNVGHIPQIESPEVFNSALIKALHDI